MDVSTLLLRGERALARRRLRLFRPLAWSEVPGGVFLRPSSIAWATLAIVLITAHFRIGLPWGARLLLACGFGLAGIAFAKSIAIDRLDRLRRLTRSLPFVLTGAPPAEAAARGSILVQFALAECPPRTLKTLLAGAKVRGFEVRQGRVGLALSYHGLLPLFPRRWEALLTKVLIPLHRIEPIWQVQCQALARAERIGPVEAAKPSLGKPVEDSKRALTVRDVEMLQGLLHPRALA